MTAKPLIEPPPPEPDRAAVETRDMVVRIRVVSAGASRDVLVRTRSRATVGDVLARLHGAGHESAVASVDGLVLPAHARWVDVAPPDGTTVHIGGLPPNRASVGSRFEVAVVSGPAAGLRYPLPEGTTTLGRGTSAGLRIPDGRLSRVHLRVSTGRDGVTIEDAGSSNGTLIDGRRLVGQQPVSDLTYVVAGSNVLAFRHSDARQTAARRLPGSSRRIVQVPPRISPQTGPHATLVQPPDPAGTSKAHVSVLAIIAPLLLSGAMAYFTRQPLYLLFAVLSPVLTVTTYLSTRRTLRRETHEATAAHKAALASHHDDLEEARSQQTRLRREAAPDLAQLYAAALGPTSLLWQRAPGDDDFLRVRVGTVGRDADIDVRSGDGRPLPTPLTPDVPVTVQLRDIPLLGIAGPVETRDGVTRAVLTQLSVAHSPQDVAVHVLTNRSRLSFWDAAKWLPHVHDANSSGSVPSIATGEAGAVTIAANLRNGAGTGTSVVIIDAVADYDDSPAVTALTAHAIDGQLRVIRLAARFSDLPQPFRASIELGPSPSADAVLRLPERPDETFRVDLLNADTFDEVARALAGWAAPSTPRTGAEAAGRALPDSVGYLASLGHPTLEPEQVLHRWSQPAALAPVAVVGVGEDGHPVTVDLRSGLDGPNSFVGGMTGSGKSDFLRGFLASMALSCPPSALNLLLIDFKEGSGLGVLRDLPHTAALVTNDDLDQLPRVLKILHATREDRQRTLTMSGFDSFDQAQDALGAQTPFPRLLVVVDEFAVLRQSVPEALARLVDVVRRGRSAGMHLLLSTQTISNAVSQDLSDNTTLSICLRVKNDAESRAVIGIPDAARLPPWALGRGYLTSGEPARTFQSGWVGARTSPQQQALDVVVEQLQIGGPRERGGSAGASTGLPSDLERVIAATWDAVKLGGLRPASPIGDAPLPVLVRVDELPPQPVGAQTLPLQLALGLLDEPTRRRQVPWTLDLGVHGHLVVVGGTRSGRSTLLRTLAAVASSKDGSPTPQIYVIDGAARQLTCLAALPNVGAVVPSDDDERLLRLLAVLQREVARRQGEPAPEPDLPPILVLIDRFESLHDDSFAVHGPDLGTMPILTQLLRDGPGVGLHVVLATDPSKLSTRAVESISARLVLNLPSREAYVAAGVPPDSVPAAVLPPGRGIWSVTSEDVQIAVFGDEPGLAAEAQAVARLAHTVRTGETGPMHVPEWRDQYLLRNLPAPDGARVVLGVGGPQLSPVELDLSRLGPGLLVYGPRGCGRSTVLTTIAEQLCRPGRHGPAMILVAPRGGALTEFAGRNKVLAVLDGLDAVADLPQHLRDAPEPVVVLVDDGAEALTGAAGEAMDAAVAMSRSGHTFVAVTAAPQYSNATREWLKTLRVPENVLLLRATSRADMQLFGLGATGPDVTPAPRPGRGLLFLDGEPRRVQVATGT